MDEFIQLRDELTQLTVRLTSGAEEERQQALRTLLGAHTLPWRFGRACLAPSASNELRATAPILLEKLLAPAAIKVVEGQGERRAHLLKGMVRVIQAAIARSGGVCGSRYEEQAIAAYEAAFAPMGIAGLGGQVVEDVISRGLAATVACSHQATILLDAQIETGSVSVLAERLPDRPGVLLPDPIGLGLVELDDDWLKGFARAWSYLTSRRDYPGPGVRWALAGHQGVLAPFVGPSGAAAFAAAAWSALTGVRLDRRVAVSATFAGEAERPPDGRLGEVGGAQNKCKGAKDIELDRVLFHPEALRSDFDSGKVPKGVAVIEVTTFEAAWEHLTGRVRALEAYARAEWKDVSSRLRFLPPGLNPSDPPADVQDLAAAFQRLHVPFRVLVNVWPPES